MARIIKEGFLTWGPILSSNESSELTRMPDIVPGFTPAVPKEDANVRTQ
jgi:hypothetical protein